MVGDSPAVHTQKFRGEKSGIFRVCEKTGAKWVDFMTNPAEKISEEREDQNCGNSRSG